MTDNILEFPISDEMFPSSREEAMNHITQVRQEFCDEVSSDVMDALYAVLNSYGITVRPEPIHIKDTVFVEEAIKALLYRHKNIQHSFHEIAESVISITPDAQKELDRIKKSAAPVVE
jgi:hypothetical protein